MPTNTPEKKIDNVRRYDAEAVLYGDNYDQAEAEALRRVSHGRTWISPYNDRQVIAGAGTIGLEIMAQLPEVERVLAPVSGGGARGKGARPPGRLSRPSRGPGVRAESRDAAQPRCTSAEPRFSGADYA